MLDYSLYNILLKKRVIESKINVFQLLLSALFAFVCLHCPLTVTYSRSNYKDCAKVVIQYSI